MKKIMIKTCKAEIATAVVVASRKWERERERVGGTLERTAIESHHKVNNSANCFRW